MLKSPKRVNSKTCDKVPQLLFILPQKKYLKTGNHLSKQKNPPIKHHKTRLKGIDPN
jgi:hypothetical protein